MISFRDCPKCGYKPRPGDRGVLYKCKSCGLDYSKYDKRHASIIILAFIFVGLVILSGLMIENKGGLSEALGAIKSKYITFAQTTGTITSSKKTRIPTRGSHYYEHNIYYGFTVENKIYISDTITFQSKRKNIDELVSKYQVGDTVTVYYDANDPDFSVLEPSVVGYEQIFWGLSVFITMPFLFWLFEYANFNSLKITRND